MNEQVKTILSFAFLMLAVQASAADNYQKRVDAKLAKMALSDFVKGVTVEDDDLTTVAVISSINAFRINQGILSETQSDVALKVGIDKKTGRTIFQVHAFIGYSGGWRYYQQATYLTPTGPENAEVQVISRDLSDCIALT